MRKTAIPVAVLAFAVLMILPVMRSVNLPAGKPVTTDSTLSADGWPLPIPHRQVEALVADGGPLPPPIPKSPSMDLTTLVADGGPLPPPIPKSPSMDVTTIVADGGPLPPPIPKSPASLTHV